MKLKDYFTMHCVNISKWSKKHQINRTTLQLVLKGYVPSMDIAIRIYKATNRAVTPTDLGVLS